MEVGQSPRSISVDFTVNLCSIATHVRMHVMKFADGFLENGIVRPQTYQPGSALQVKFVFPILEKTVVMSYILVYGCHVIISIITVRLMVYAERKGMVYIKIVKW